jgi:PhzF family phenazine biosynthesis protein
MADALAILQVDAFTDRPFAGNPAGVVLDAAGLPEARMQQIAAEMNLAETAFVSPARQRDADLGLRWFSPTREVAYCGHATVATVHALLEAGRLDGDHVTFETLNGPLEVVVEPCETAPLIWLQPAVPVCAPVESTLDDILAALGLPPDAPAAWAPPAVTPDHDLLLPARSLEMLRALRPDMSRLGQVATGHQLRGICMVSLETVDPGSATHARFFAPHFGIPEDPVTGSVHSSIGVWLLEAGRLPVTAGSAAFRAEQGDLLGRPGRLHVEVGVAPDGHVSRVRVGGRAVTVLRGTLALPPGP